MFIFLGVFFCNYLWKFDSKVLSHLYLYIFMYIDFFSRLFVCLYINRQVQKCAHLSHEMNNNCIGVPVCFAFASPFCFASFSSFLYNFTVCLCCCCRHLFYDFSPLPPRVFYFLRQFKTGVTRNGISQFVTQCTLLLIIWQFQQIKAGG